MARQTHKEKVESTVARLLGTSAEPKPEKIETKVEMSSILNWYNAHKDPKDATKYLSDYAKKNKIKGKIVTSKTVSTMAWLVRMVHNGINLPEYAHEYIKLNIHEIFEEEIITAEVDDVPVKIVVSIQERMNDKIAEIAGEIEGSIDEYILSGFKNIPSPYGIMHDKVKAAHAGKIVEIFKKRRVEFDEVLNTEDEQLKEGYSNFSKSEIKKLVAYCDQIILDANKLSGESKVSRKPRKRKVKTPDQLVAKVQVCEESLEYNLKSEPTKTIIGATSLWVFNIKNKKLGVYHALDSEGFGIKGTSLTNFSEMKSKQKTLRKPDTVLPEVVKGAKVYLRNAMENLTTKDSPLNGRLNKDTIIVKVLK